MKSLDQKAGVERKRPELKIYTDVISYNPYKIKTYAGESWRTEAKDIKDSDWVPSIVAAHLAGVSKQAIHDRIKRETLKSREVHRSSWYGDSGQKVVLVRLGDAKKKKKAGRPKGSRNKKTEIISRPGAVLGCKNGSTKVKATKGYLHPTREQCPNDGSPIDFKEPWQCPWCFHKNKPGTKCEYCNAYS